jgi:CDP-2,3-bis-(O-geranylgeranyl)-sn-glycerol synthase
MFLPNPLHVLWIILPAYIANSMAINTKALPFLKKYDTPIDFGKTYAGRQILGPGKTWRGLVGGVFSGMLCAHLQTLHQPAGFPHMSLEIGFLMAFGALFGDLTESFIKRRSGLERGHPLFLMDQLDYVVGAFFFGWIILPVDLGYLLVAALMTVPIHFFSSIIAWQLKLKKNPW